MTEEPIHLVIEGSRGTLCNLHGLRGDQKVVCSPSYGELRAWVANTSLRPDTVCEDCEGRLALHELAETDLEGDSDLRNLDQFIIHAQDATGGTPADTGAVIKTSISSISNKFKV